MARKVRAAFDPKAFLSTVDHKGRPTVSYKGGDPGFVKVVDATTLVFPSYDGNGMFLSMGNIAGDGRIGLLFIDFDTPHRVRVHADATVSADDPLLAEYPGADLIVRATVIDSFVNCPRYIHRMPLVEQSEYAPCAGHTPPEPKWKSAAHFREVLPPGDAASVTAEGDGE